VVSPWRKEYAAGKRSVRITNRRIEVSEKNESELRFTHVPDNCTPVWLGFGGDIAFFANIPQPRASTGFFPLENPLVEPTIYRLDLDSMQWLAPLRMGGTSRQEQGKTQNRFTSLGTVAISDGVLAVLTYSGTKKPVADNPSIVSQNVSHYKVSLIQLRGSKPEWERPFQWNANDVGVPKLDLKAATPTDLRRPGTELLSWIPGHGHRGESLLVCAGAKEDVVCLAASDGRERWRIERIWEFSRAYTGPSVFEHSIWRLGMDVSNVEEAGVVATEVDADDQSVQRLQERAMRAAITDARKLFYSIYDGRITAGPLIVPADEAWSSFSVFVGVARDPKNGHPRRLPDPNVAEGLVYEIDGDNGYMEAMTHLPRGVVARPYRVLRGGLVWACDRGCLVRLEVSKPDFSRGFTFSGDDMLCRIKWYREIPFRKPTAWFLADVAPNTVCFSKDFMFRADLAFVRKPEDKVYHYLITVVDLQSGVDRDISLDVPFDGDFILPESGKATFPGTTHALEPHLLRIVNLEAEGDVLHVTMDEVGKRGVCLSFDLSVVAHSCAESQMDKRSAELNE